MPSGRLIQCTLRMAAFRDSFCTANKSSIVLCFMTQAALIPNNGILRLAHFPGKPGKLRHAISKVSDLSHLQHTPSSQRPHPSTSPGSMPVDLSMPSRCILQVAAMDTLLLNSILPGFLAANAATTSWISSIGIQQNSSLHFFGFHTLTWWT